MSSFKNKVKRVGESIVTQGKRVAGVAMNTAKRAAVAARSKYDEMRKGPTPYVNQKSNRIYKSNNGAVFTKNANGDRNYKPVANAIKKPNGKNIPITSNNVNTVPMNMRPKNVNN